MLGKRITVLTVFSIAAGLLVFSSAGSAQSEKPKIAPQCKQCHKPDEKILRGLFMNVSKKAGTIQMQIGPATWLVRFDDSTKLIGGDKFSEIPKEKEIAISFTERNGELYAESLSIEPPAKVPEEKLIKVDALQRLVAMGGEKGDVTLVDSRPGFRYNEGHIPGALSLFDGEFDRNIEKLPKNKERLLIFYCGGLT